MSDFEDSDYFEDVGSDDCEESNEDEASDYDEGNFEYQGRFQQGIKPTEEDSKPEERDYESDDDTGSTELEADSTSEHGEEDSKPSDGTKDKIVRDAATRRIAKGRAKAVTELLKVGKQGASDFVTRRIKRPALKKDSATTAKPTTEDPATEKDDNTINPKPERKTTAKVSTSKKDGVTVKAKLKKKKTTKEPTTKKDIVTTNTKPKTKTKTKDPAAKKDDVTIKMKPKENATVETSAYTMNTSTASKSKKDYMDEKLESEGAKTATAEDDSSVESETHEEEIVLGVNEETYKEMVATAEDDSSVESESHEEEIVLDVDEDTYKEMASDGSSGPMSIKDVFKEGCLFWNQEAQAYLSKTGSIFCAPALKNIPDSETDKFRVVLVRPPTGNTSSGGTRPTVAIERTRRSGTKHFISCGDLRGNSNTAKVTYRTVVSNKNTDVLVDVTSDEMFYMEYLGNSQFKFQTIKEYVYLHYDKKTNQVALTPCQGPANARRNRQIQGVWQLSYKRTRVGELREPEAPRKGKGSIVGSVAGAAAKGLVRGMTG